MRRTDILERKGEILEWIKENLPNTEIARRLKCKVDTLKSYYTKMGITYSGNQGGRGYKTDPKRKSAEELAKNPLISSHKLKLRLLEDGTKEYRCERCGLTEWNNKPIPLELHHKDGNHYNNDLTNLEVLCPNCHAQTDNYSCKKHKEKIVGSSPTEGTYRL